MPSASRKPEHQRLIDNLLKISSRDSSINFFPNGRSVHDMAKILSETDYQKAFENAEFQLLVKNTITKTVINELKNTSDFEAFATLINNYDIYLSKTRLTLLAKDFEEQKDIVIKDIQKKATLHLKRWKMFQQKYYDLQVQTNLWPLYIGTFILKFKTKNGRKVHAPLLLKKVQIQIIDNKIRIKTLDDSYDINEKLVFIINEAFSIDLPLLNTFDLKDFNNLIDFFRKELKSDLDNSTLVINHKSPLPPKKEIDNVRMQLVPGLIMGIMSPLGGVLRKKLEEILDENDDLEDLLNIDHLKNFEDEAEDFDQTHFRLHPSDFSQEKALNGSFLDHSIIWGPPGTGKSQTITNLLANLLRKDKTVIVTSEKKAALDVIKKRMGKLSKFMFFGMTDKTANKKEFYEPLKELAENLKIKPQEPSYIKVASSLVTGVEKNVYKQKNELSKEEITIKDLMKLNNVYLKGEYEISVIKDFFTILKNNQHIHSKLKQGIKPESLNKKAKIKALEEAIQLIAESERFFHDEYQEYSYRSTNKTEQKSNFGAKLFFALFTFGLSFKGYISKKQVLENQKFNAENKLWNTEHKANVDKKNLILKQEIDNFNHQNAIRLQPLRKELEKNKKYDKDVDRIIDFLEYINYDYAFLKQLSQVNDINNLKNFALYLQQEESFINLENKFISDEETLEYILLNHFRDKLYSLRNTSTQKYQKVNSFLKACNSAWQLPYKFMKNYKEIIDYLFSIFISTPESLASYINWDRRFDYAVFDEASQLHLEKALPFIYIAERCVIAGDDQQMKPTNFFVANAKIDESLDAEENVRSLLEYAHRKDLHMYMLNKNYRSNYAQLMTFSSSQFYEAKLEVVDKYIDIPETPIEVHNVNGIWENQANEVEAIAILDKLLEIKPKYKKIIILAFNSKQKRYITELFFNEPKYAEVMDWLKDEEVYLRNLENIQGDEADCVLISVAYDENARLGATYVARPEGRNSLNVAISRAKSKMIVFKSIASQDVKINRDNPSMETFREWLQFLELTPEERKNYLSKNKEEENFDFESNFEKEVYDFLHRELDLENEDIDLVTQYVVGSYRIDQAFLKDGQFLLGLEIDGAKYHSTNKKMIEDMDRQKFLEAKGYPIHRIGEMTYNYHKQKIINDIRGLLEDYV